MNKQLVGVLGPKGSYTEQAGLDCFPNAELRSDYLSPQSVIADVASLKLDYGVVPAENSINGVVAATLDSLLISRVNIIGEYVLSIHHVLASHHEGRDFKRVLSHPQGLNQCRDYLRMNYPTCIQEPASSTSQSALRVSEGLFDTLSICSEHAAKTYGLKVIAREISMSNNNETCFLIVGNELTESTGDDKTSIAFGLKDKPGALYDSLKIFKDYNINLTRIESRPTKKRLGEYLFLVDLEGHVNDKQVSKALTDLSASTASLKVLGSYKKYKSRREVGE